jgi:hypothetical protein
VLHVRGRIKIPILLMYSWVVGFISLEQTLFPITNDLQFDCYLVLLFYTSFVYFRVRYVKIHR